MQLADAALTTADQKERLSVSYVLALAAKAGYTTAEHDLDRIGIDMEIHAGDQMPPASLALQLKATERLRTLAVSQQFSFQLEASTYNHLRDPRVQVPRLLVVLDMPRNSDKWLAVTADGLLIGGRAYWLNLKGWPEASHTRETVRIPPQQVFDVEAMRQLMDDSRNRRL